MNEKLTAVKKIIDSMPCIIEEVSAINSLKLESKDSGTICESLHIIRCGRGYYRVTVYCDLTYREFKVNEVGLGIINNMIRIHNAEVKAKIEGIEEAIKNTNGFINRLLDDQNLNSLKTIFKDSSRYYDAGGLYGVSDKLFIDIESLSQEDSKKYEEYLDKITTLRRVFELLGKAKAL